MDGDMPRFPAPVEHMLDHSEGVCAARGGRLTAQRRAVLGLILQAEGPLGAYELLDTLRATQPGAAPPTVYRALDFLVAHGLIHKLERLSAYVGCVAGEHAEGSHAHAAQFLICRGCGRVTEIEDAAVMDALAAAARRTGFALTRATMEAEGLCAACSRGAS